MNVSECLSHILVQRSVSNPVSNFLAMLRPDRSHDGFFFEILEMMKELLATSICQSSHSWRVISITKYLMEVVVLLQERIQRTCLMRVRDGYEWSYGRVRGR